MTDDQPNSPELERDLARESHREAAAEAAVSAGRRARRPHIPLRGDIGPQEMFALIGGFGLLALELAEIILTSAGGEYAIVHPVFPLAALVFFLYPFRREVVARRTIQLGVAAFLVWLAVSLLGVLIPFVIAFTVAYLFYPLVARLDRHGVPRVATAIVIVLGILGIYALVGFVLVPALIKQFDEMIASTQQWLRDANRMFDQEKIARELARFGIPRSQARRIVIEQIQPQLQSIVATLISWFAAVLQNIASVIEGVFMLVLIPFLTLYMTIDFKRIRLFTRSTLLQDDPQWVYYIRRADAIMSSYLRGILITSTMVGVTAIGVLSVFGVPYAAVIGLLTGILNLIPTIGMFLNLGIAMVIYLVAPGDFWYNTLVTAVMIFSLHALNSNLVEPRILGDRVGMHPVMVLASLFIFGHFLGFFGLLVAVPMTAVILMFLREWYQRSMRTEAPVFVNPENTTA